jgi:predicted nucleic acid-binding protein
VRTVAARHIRTMRYIRIIVSGHLNPVVASARLLATRIWELRGNVTYDAAYVATAEHYQCALITTGARLARAAGTHCPVTLISS